MVALTGKYQPFLIVAKPLLQGIMEIFLQKGGKGQNKVKADAMEVSRKW